MYYHVAFARARTARSLRMTAPRVALKVRKGERVSPLLLPKASEAVILSAEGAKDLLHPLPAEGAG